MPGAGRSAGKLRGELSGFVGRKSELAAIRVAFGRARLITLCGPGGIGKTRGGSDQAVVDGVFRPPREADHWRRVEREQCGLRLLDGEPARVEDPWETGNITPQLRGQRRGPAPPTAPRSRSTTRSSCPPGEQPPSAGS